MKKTTFLIIILIFPGVLIAQWEWQNPTTTGNNLNGIQLVNQNIGYVVGEEGTILRTIDGGNSWNDQLSGIYNNLNSVMFIDSLNGWIVGEFGTILKTTDSGNHWQEIINQYADYCLTSVFFVNQYVGWAVGGLGSNVENSASLIIKTTDSGITWFEQGEKTSYLFSCFFIDETTGWTVGGTAADTNVILKTTDGGLTWEHKDINISGHYLRSVYFRDQYIGFIAGSIGLILKTTDGGDHWIQSSTGSNSDLRQIKFYQNSELGWITGSSFFRTMNLGESWQEIEFPEPGFIIYKSFDFLDQNNLFSVAGRGRIVKSTDSGLNWQHISGFFYNPQSVQFFDSLNGITSADKGRFLKTFNGGNNWQEINTGTNLSFTKLFMINQTTGFSLGYNYTLNYNDYILKTTDGGETWSVKSIYYASHLKNIFFWDDQLGWACGYQGLIVHTTDGGETWNKQTSNLLSGYINSIYFISAQTGFAVSQNDTLGSIFYTTINGGLTWDSTQIWSTGFHIYGPKKVIFVNNQEGWVLAENCLLKTNDKGQSWNMIIHTDDFTTFSDMCFVGDNVWITGYSGTIINSTNNGESWGVQMIDDPFNGGYNNSFESIFMLDENVGWVVGFPYAAIKTTNGGQQFIHPPSVPLLISPENNSSQWQPPYFSWQRVEGMTFRLEISKDQDFDTIDYSGMFISRYVYPPIVYSDNTRYFWRLRTENQLGVSDWSEVRNFYLIHAAGVQNDIANPIKRFSLSQNYPNPFNPTTKINYSVPEGQDRFVVKLIIYDILGREITTLVNEEKPAGEYKIEFKGTNLPSGVYFYRLTVGGLSQTRKMVYLK